ncbi:hypothetical protein [Pseudomonas sp. PDM04]|uniref:hypothetical protein n=1 Tax=Pseudomonas sp. PDM04 TaxID=2769296 RepID=UPI00177C2929|nr:hypothetical protein [Pseudomonas sp. PDM04]MBD9440837.1 hypothetical protein [Pseudomonas sp. PDM04]
MKSESTFSSTHAGQIDPTFGVDGLFTPPLPDPSDQKVVISGITRDADGSYYCSCSLMNRNGMFEYGCFHLTRQGELDTGFGTNGYARGVFQKASGYITHSYGDEIVIQNIEGEKKILVVGELIDKNGIWKSALARLNADGSLDTRYSRNGISVITLPPLANDAESDPPADKRSDAGTAQAHSLPLPDNKVLLIRNSQSMQKDFGYILRIDERGNLDPTFNQSGFTIIDIPETPETDLLSLLRTDEGKYVVAGYVSYPPNENEALLVQLNADGTFDTTFNGKGYRIVSQLPDTSLVLQQLTTQPNKRLLGMGFAKTEVNAGLLVSLESDGTFNIQFNGAQPLQTRLGGEATRWYAGKTQPDGHVLMVGSIGSRYNLVVARVLSKGEIDPTFGQGTGYVRFDGMLSFTRLPVVFEEDGSFVFASFYSTDVERTLCIARGLIGG